jgi:hypothetical protein
MIFDTHLPEDPVFSARYYQRFQIFFGCKYLVILTAAKNIENSFGPKKVDLVPSL